MKLKYIEDDVPMMIDFSGQEDAGTGFAASLLGLCEAASAFGNDTAPMDRAMFFRMVLSKMQHIIEVLEKHEYPEVCPHCFALSDFDIDAMIEKFGNGKPLH